MAELVTLATCNLNQWALDFEGNRDRIIESIRIAKERGAKFRTGPELEVTGYGCLDHFLERDTYLHSWQVMRDILEDKSCYGLIIDVGMPIMHKGIRFNCRVICADGKILMIRPKVWLANDGNYREMRYFLPWPEHKVDNYVLPKFVEQVTSQKSVTFGDCILNAGKTRLGFETCEEMFTPQSPHIQQALDGVEIFTNSSGSHHELRKLNTRLRLITEATRKCGGVYLYANQQGCDGDRLYYDGSAMIIVNGEVVAQSSQFSLNDIEVVTATVNLSDVWNYRSSVSFGMQTLHAKQYKEIPVDYDIKTDDEDSPCHWSKAIKPRIHEPEEEIALGPACWLWDYLRRSKTSGYFVPLSGGIDSCATAVIVYSMCLQVVKECQNGNEQVLEDARRLAQKEAPWVPSNAKELCNLIFNTCYMGTSNSSDDTRSRARDLAHEIGSYHLDVNIDSIVLAFITLVTTLFSVAPKYKVNGGSPRENLALQNIQARVRMVLSYTLALLLPWYRGIPGGLLVLGSANVDESLRGYLTKYDCSSADINPIGSISKKDLTKFVKWGVKAFDLPILESFVNATPTAELEPITDTYVQSDEVDMGLTYEELSVFGRLRKVNQLGPYSMFMTLKNEWTEHMTLSEIATKVKRFFYYYAINRHKMTVLTPSYHAEAYSPDDNRFDLRPFLIRPFPWAFKLIDNFVSKHGDYTQKKN